jgi:hypothetical protein
MSKSFNITKDGKMIKIKYKDTKLELDSTDNNELEEALHIIADFIYTLDHGKRMQTVAQRLQGLDTSEENGDRLYNNNEERKK